MHDDRQDFLRERRERLLTTDPADPAWPAAREFFLRTIPLRYSYNFDWLGVPIIQYPQDMVAMQELIWRVRPDLIVETGIARGGSSIFYASMLKLLGEGGKVIGIDLDIRPHNRDSIESHPLGEAVVLIEGSSLDDDVLEQVGDHARGAERVLVVLDSHHTKDHVAQEIELYSPLVTKGSYLVVFDTAIEYLSEDQIADRDWGPGNNPMNAVDDFLATNDRFAIDTLIDAKLLVSVAPRGYLECVKDPE